jgi:integrase
MAHVERRADRKYRARYRGPDGRERSRTFDTKRDAERWLANVETKKANREWIDPALGKTLFEEWSNRWIASVEHELKPKTAEGYRSLLRSQIWPAFGSWPIASIEPTDVRAWLGIMSATGLSASRRRQALVVLRAVLSAAVGDRLVAVNAAREVKAPRVVRREAAFFDPATVEQIAVAIGEPYDLLVRVLAALGLRWGEAAALRRSSVDLLRARLLIDASIAEVNGKRVLGTTKTHAERTVPLSPSLVAAFERHLAERVDSDPGAFVFTAPVGGTIGYNNFRNRVWKPTLERLGLPSVGIHVLRHSAAARMIGLGVGPKTIQRVLGHQSAAFTLTVYGHLFESDLDDLARRLDEVRPAQLAACTRPVLAAEPQVSLRSVR